MHYLEYFTKHLSLLENGLGELLRNASSYNQDSFQSQFKLIKVISA